MSETKKSLFKKGAYVYVEGDEDVDEVYIVERGAIELVTENKKIKRYKTTISDGEIFGFISALIRRPRMESAFALKDSIVISVNRSRFIYLVQKNPDIALKIIRYFAEELRLYDEMMFSLKETETSLVPDELKLFNIGEYYFNTKAYKHALYVLTRYLELYPTGSERDVAQTMINEIAKSGLTKLTPPAKSGVYKLYQDGQMIFCEHEPGEELYIIKEGKVKITKVNENNEILLSVLREGDIFGELAIVSEKPRNASAICIGKTSLLPIRKETLPWVLSKSPAIINKIFMAISQRIWFTYTNLEAKLYNKPITRVYALIENKLLQDNISLKSKEPVVLNFTVEDLLRAAGVTLAQKDQTAELLLEDTNLEFNFGQLTIRNPSLLVSKANFYKSRDLVHVELEATATKEKAKKISTPSEEVQEITVKEETEEEIAKIREPENQLPSVESSDANDELKLPSQEIKID
ncbi:MAG: cyclic nucleotide-binding domain-containing protein [Spirochaetes bacterium]|nr:cyclic nucleotide-binding domain-containing protein [Spirochaetota bacterium]